MKDDDGYFGEDVAASYDDGFEGQFDPAVIGVTAGTLAELAGGAAGSGHGRALEFAIGTGRVALPLAARGVEVHGIDLSRATMARDRSMPCTSTPRAASGSATRPVPMANSSARP